MKTDPRAARRRDLRGRTRLSWQAGRENFDASRSVVVFRG
jgi:hypothetical protein